MRFQCNYNAVLNIIESDTHGLANKNELIDMLRCILDLCIQHDTAHILIDHSDLDAGPITMDDISGLSSIAMTGKDMLKPRKCAHIVAKDVQFGLVRAWEIMTDIADNSNFQTMVFRNKKAAVEWLKTSS